MWLWSFDAEKNWVRGETNFLLIRMISPTLRIWSKEATATSAICIKQQTTRISIKNPKPPFRKKWRNRGCCAAKKKTRIEILDTRTFELFLWKKFRFVGQSIEIENVLDGHVVLLVIYLNLIDSEILHWLRKKRWEKSVDVYEKNSFYRVGINIFKF